MDLWGVLVLILFFGLLSYFMIRATRGLRDPDLSKLADLDPNRITVEIVAGLLRTSRWAARQICETAVRRGEFERNGEDYKLVKQRT